MSTENRPGGPKAHRPLHFIWLADVSGSMEGDKIESLNYSVRNAIPAMQKAADEQPDADVMVRVITFSDGATWHIGTPTPVADFTWVDLIAGGLTDMGKALMLVSDALKMPPMESRALPPVLVLVSDGQPTDDWRNGLKELMSQNWGQRAVRIAIAIGSDADLEMLKEFVANPEMPVLRAHNPEELVKYVRWVSTAVLKSASAPRSSGIGPAERAPVQVPLPPPPEVEPVNAGDVW